MHDKCSAIEYPRRSIGEAPSEWPSRTCPVRSKGGAARRTRRCGHAISIQLRRCSGYSLTPRAAYSVRCSQTVFLSLPFFVAGAEFTIRLQSSWRRIFCLLAVRHVNSSICSRFPSTWSKDAPRAFYQNEVKPPLSRLFPSAASRRH